MKNIPFITYFQRTWMLFIVFFASNWAALTEHHFPFLGKWVVDENLGGIWVAQTPMEAIGPILWIVPFGMAIYLMCSLQIHLYYRSTIDSDIHDLTYCKDWQQCTPYERIYITNQVRNWTFAGLCILCSQLARAATPIPVDQVRRWTEASVTPKSTMALDVAVALYRRNQSRYEVIQAMRPNGVPAPILFCLHYRESDNNFRCHAHEGSSLQHRTRDVPKNRPLAPEPPYTFEQSAEDAYYIYERPTLDAINWASMQAALDKMESFNGYGYRARGVNAPYLWSGTSIYAGGKYVRDGVFSRTAFDQQLGCAAILKHMLTRGIPVRFAGPRIAFRL